MENIECIKAAVFDVDGTLYDYRTGRVLPSSIDSAKKLKADGYLIIVATGRTKVMLCREITECIAPDYYILSNGALITDKNNLCIFARTFSRKDTQNGFLSELASMEMHSSIAAFANTFRPIYFMMDMDLM